MEGESGTEQLKNHCAPKRQAVICPSFVRFPHLPLLFLAWLYLGLRRSQFFALSFPSPSSPFAVLQDWRKYLKRAINMA